MHAIRFLLSLALLANAAAHAQTFPAAADTSVSLSKGNVTSNLTSSFNTGNKTITVNTGGAIVVTGNGTNTATNVTLRDTDATHFANIVLGSNLTANRTVTITPGDAAREITLTGNATLNQDTSTTATPTWAGVKLWDTDSSHGVTFSIGSNLTANRTVSIVPGDANRTLTLTGNATINQDTSTAGSPSFVGLTVSGGTITGGANGIKFGAGTFATGSGAAYYDSVTNGLVLVGRTGGTNDLYLSTSGGSNIIRNPTGTENIVVGNTNTGSTVSIVSGSGGSGNITMTGNVIASSNLTVTANLTVSGTGTQNTAGVLKHTQATTFVAPTIGTASGGFMLLSSAGTYGLFAGVEGTGSPWLQAMRNDSATAYDIRLNPSGGNVVVGATLTAGSNIITGAAGQFQSDTYRQQSGDRALLNFSGTTTAVGSGTTGDTTIIRSNGLTAFTLDSSRNGTLVGSLTVSGTGTSSFAGDLRVSHSVASNARLIAQKNTAPANNHIAQLILAQGVGDGFGANDRTYQVIANGVSSTATDFIVQYWDGSTYIERLKVPSTGGLAVNSTSTVKGIRTATATFDFGTISAGASSQTTGFCHGSCQRRFGAD